jgi:hypothetical protein
MKMKLLLPILLFIHLCAALPAVSAPTGDIESESKNNRTYRGKMDCDAGPVWCKSDEGSCSPEMRGRCGKRRGDWYGARQPVADAAEARRLLQSYFTGKEYAVSEIIEKKWGFRANILDKSGKVIDRVMIDKRTGRIRSLN